jgi:hypothetical protein
MASIVCEELAPNRRGQVARWKNTSSAASRKHKVVISAGQAWSEGIAKAIKRGAVRGEQRVASTVMELLVPLGECSYLLVGCW